MSNTKDCSNCYYYQNVDPYNPEPVMDCTWIPDEDNNYGADGRPCDGEEDEQIGDIDMNKIVEKHLTDEVELTQKLLDSMEMVQDIDKTAKCVNARLRNLIEHKAQEVDDAPFIMEAYIQEINTLTKELQALTDYRTCICKV